MATQKQQSNDQSNNLIINVNNGLVEIDLCKDDTAKNRIEITFPCHTETDPIALDDTTHSFN